jgi:enoyl-CoA hydratase/carnithine racemase
VIRGWCVGGGISLALNCDLRICSADARFFHAASKYGQGYAYDFTRQMVRVLGLATTNELLMTGRRYDATEALRVGLVNRVGPVDGFDAFVADYLAGLVDKAPLSQVSYKRTVAQIIGDPDDRDLGLIEKLYVDCVESEDYAEGGRAFAEKRLPIFTGK